MKFVLDGLTVYFPYEFLYPEQYRYMLELKRALDAHGHACLEMPTGTGKTITLLSLVTSYQLAHPECGKLIYCTRTVPEMEKVLEELEVVRKAREDVLGKDAANIVGLGLSARRNMCIHEEVSQEPTRETVDKACRELTAPWVRDKDDAPKCSFYESLQSSGVDDLLEPGVYTLEQLREEGQKKGWCPYFMARQGIARADVIVYNYGYLLDPKISSLISSKLEKECIVVFDEAHNIDNICTEAMSITLKEETLAACRGNIRKLKEQVADQREANVSRLKAEYDRLVSGLALSAGVDPSDDPAADLGMGSPLLLDDMLAEAVPGNIRQAKLFVELMAALVYTLRTKLTEVREAKREDTAAYLHELSEAISWEPKAMKFCAERMRLLLRTLEVVDVDEFTPLTLVADFATLLSTYTKGFALILEPHDERYPDVRDPVMQLSCMDASIAIAPVLERFQSIVLTSGTISVAEDLYPKLLGFVPKISKSIPMVLQRNVICPLIVSKGESAVPLSSEYKNRQNSTVIRNYGDLLLRLASVVPDGMICFFVSYICMEQMVGAWNSDGDGADDTARTQNSTLAQLLEHKLIFIETPDIVESSLALKNYRRACDSGRGAIFMSVARGKVAEGVDFEKHYGRCVVMIGVPYQYTESRTLRARLEYIREKYKIRENTFLAFDALRQASQCLGRVVRSKTDYGLMILADERYSKNDKKDKLPPWILQSLRPEQCNLTVSSAIDHARHFFRDMAQPLPAPALASVKRAADSV